MMVLLLRIMEYAVLMHWIGFWETYNMTELWDVLDENGSKTGRVCKRGPMEPGNYHLIVHVWTMNSKGEFLISKRTPNKNFPGMWECTGGSAVTGDDSLTTAIKEVREELGITLDPKNGQLFRRFRRFSTDIIDVWLFRQDADITDVVFQPGETCDAKWATRKQLNEMIIEGTFIGRDLYFYLDEFYYFCDKPDHYEFNFWSTLDKLVSQSKIIIDRPKGTTHPKWNFTYPLDYGYLENTSSMDGYGIDLWKGSMDNAIDAVICTVDLLKKDSEIKILVGLSEEEKQTVLAWHNDSEMMKAIMIRR